MPFQNFGFNQNYPKVGAAPPPPSWTPADFNNLKYYFTAGAGLTLSGSWANGWTDQVSSVTMTTGSAAAGRTAPLYVASSAMNGQPALLFNSGSITTNRLQVEISTGISSSNDLTVIGILKPKQNSLGDYQIYGGIGVNTVFSANYETAMYVNSPGNNNKFGVYVFAGGTATDSALSTTYSEVPTWHAVTYNSAAGTIEQYLNSTTAAVTITGKAINPTKSTFKLIAGNYSDGSDVGLTAPPDLLLAELIYITGIPTSQEFSDLATYVTTKYGT